nr:unnamed protein product [Callosobruchus analis]
MEDITEVCRLCLEKKTLVWIFDTRINVDDMKNIIYVTTGVQDKHKLYVEEKKSSLNSNTAAEHNPLPAKGEMKDKKPALSVHPSIKEISAKHLNILIPRKCLKLNMLPVVSMPMNEVENYFERRNIDFHKHARQVLRSIKKGADTDSESVEGSDCTLKSNSSDNIETQPSKIDVVMPIKIATNKTGYAIVSKAQTVLKTEDEKNKCVAETISRKRKLSDTEADSAAINKKISVKNDLSTLEIGKSVPLYICDICNSVQYSQNVLNKHKLKHLICQFCKLRFKSLERKHQHLENDCFVKNLKTKCLQTQSEISLERIELNRSIRAKYPQAFAGFPPLPFKKNMGESSVIEIADDDESVTDKTKIFKKSTQVDEAYKINANGSKLTTENIKSNNNSLPDLTRNIQPSNCTRNNNTNPTTTQETITSVSVVKPNIKIKNSSILDYMDPKASDIKLMRDFLTRYKNLNCCVEQSTQTELLVNTSIVVNHTEVTTEFKGLKNLLHFYKIPVVIKSGQFSVSYACDNVEEKKKNMCLWDTLQPIDIAEPKKISATEEPNTRCNAEDLSGTSVEIISAPTKINYQNSENVTVGTQKENCQSEKPKTTTITAPSTGLPLPGTPGKLPTLAELLSMTAIEKNSGQKSNDLLSIPRTSSVLQSTANCSNIIGSSANNVLRVPEKSATSSETGGSLAKTVHYTTTQPAIPKVSQPVSQSFDTFRPTTNSVLRNGETLPPQASGSSVHLPVQLPQRDLQPIVNKVSNVPQLLPMNFAKESTLQGSSENMTLAETPLPAPGSIRVKNLVDLT